MAERRVVVVPAGDGVLHFEASLSEDVRLGAREDLRGAVKEMQSAIRYRPDLIGYHQRLRELFLLSRDEVSAARTAERIDALVAARDATRGRELPKKAVPSPPPGDVLHRDDVSSPAAP